MAKMLTDETAEHVREMVRGRNDGSPPWPSGTLPAGLQTAVVRCFQDEGTSPRQHYRGRVRRITDLDSADHYDAGAEYVYLAPLDPAAVIPTSGDAAEVLAVRHGTHSGRPLYWTGGVGSGRVIRGTLAADLNQGSSATLNVSGGGTETVHDILIPSGKKIASGKTVVAYYDAGDARFNVCTLPVKAMTVVIDCSFDEETCVFSKTTDTVYVLDLATA